MVQPQNVPVRYKIWSPQIFKILKKIRLIIGNLQGGRVTKIQSDKRQLQIKLGENERSSLLLIEGVELINKSVLLGQQTNEAHNLSGC